MGAKIFDSKGWLGQGSSSDLKMPNILARWQNPIKY